LARYIPLVSLYFLLHDQVFPDNTAEACSWSFHLATWLVTIGMYFAEVILAVRTWAVWRKDRRVGLVLAALLIATIIVGCICIRTFLDTLEFGPAPYPGFRGCFITVSGSSLLYVAFIAVGSVEIVILVLMSISAFRSYRSGNTSELSNVIHRDGMWSSRYVNSRAIIISFHCCRYSILHLSTVPRSCQYDHHACLSTRSSNLASPVGVAVFAFKLRFNRCPIIPGCRVSFTLYLLLESLSTSGPQARGVPKIQYLSCIIAIMRNIGYLCL
jgi:hypothetical protein